MQVCYDIEFSKDAKFEFSRTRKDIDAIWRNSV